LKPFSPECSCYPNDITAVILAGGLGTRLRSVVSDRPKVLAEVAGRPFLAYLLEHLGTSGVRQVVLCTGYLGDQIHQVFGNEFQEIQLRYSCESEPLGTGGALKHANPLLSAFPVIVCNGDSYANVPIQQMIQFHIQQKAEVTMGVMKLNNPSQFGLVEFNDDGEVQKFSEKPSTLQAGWVNAGVYVFGKRLFDSIPDTGFVSLERDVLPRWVRKGFFAYPQSGELFDIGTPESLCNTQEYFCETRETSFAGLAMATRDKGLG